MFGKKGSAFDEKNTIPTANHGGGSIILWSCVVAGGTGNTAQIDGESHIYASKAHNGHQWHHDVHSYIQSLLSTDLVGYLNLCTSFTIKFVIEITKFIYLSSSKIKWDNLRLMLCLSLFT